MLCAYCVSAQFAKSLIKVLEVTGEEVPKSKLILNGVKAATLAIGGATVIAGGSLLSDKIQSGEAVYSVQFALNKNAKAVYWARLWGWPNIFPLLQVEGDKQYVVPEIFYNYQGGTIIWTFKVAKIPGKRAVSIFILDDHSTSNEIWNNILKTRWNVNLSGNAQQDLNGQFGVTHVTAGMTASVTATGSIQLLDKSITISGPKPICNYSVITPDPWFASEWHTAGVLKDGEGNQVGTIILSQLMNKK